MRVRKLVITLFASFFMSFLGVIFSILIGILGLIGMLLLIVYLFLPKYFVAYSKQYDGSYDPNQDALKSEQNTPYKQFTSPENWEIRFNQHKHEWDIICDDMQVLSKIGLQIFYKDHHYSNNPLIWGGEALELNSHHTSQAGDSQPQGQKSNWGTFIQEVNFWTIPSTSLTFSTEIFYYPEKQSILFEMKSSQPINFHPSFEDQQLNWVFPAFINNGTLQRSLSFKDTVFCPPQRDFHQTHGPIVIFNDAKQVIIGSALEDFLISPWNKQQQSETLHSLIKFGIHNAIPSIPRDFSHRSILVIGEGISNTIEKWAEILREYHTLQKKPLNPDIATTYLGYYTDNGAYYYYTTEKGRKSDATLLLVKKQAEKQQIPYHYYHLDSWWYQKTTNRTKQKWLGWLGSILGGALYGGALLWEPDPNYIKMPLPELSEMLGGPFTAHNRWFEPSSPYRKKYDFIEENGWVMPHDNNFWDHIMQYCQKNKIIVYEQDWMSNQMKRFSHLRNTLHEAKDWLDQMAFNAEKYGIHIQYCMETPAMVMQSIFYPAVTHCRTCDDYHGYTYKTYDIPGFTQASMLADVLGLRPFKDVFKTKKYPLFKYRGERIPELECLLAALSTGPVVPGDRYTDMDKTLILRSCRPDGRLLQPTKPITAIDLMYIKNQTYYIARAQTKLHIDQQKLVWFYVLTINLFPDRVKEKSYSLAEVGINNKYVEYDWHTHSVRMVNDTSPVGQNLKFEEYKYRVYAPVLPSGISIIGNPHKFTTFALSQFNISKMDSRECEIEVFGEEDEVVDILVSSPHSQIELIPVTDKERGELIDRTSNHFQDNCTQSLFSINFRKSGSFNLVIR